MTPLTREQIAAIRKLLASDIPDARDDASAANAAVANLCEVLPALLDIAEAVADAQTFKAVPSVHFTGCEVSIPLPMGARVAVLPLAGEA